jgi:hypothetical protein
MHRSAGTTNCHWLTTISLHARAARACFKQEERWQHILFALDMADRVLKQANDRVCLPLARLGFAQETRVESSGDRMAAIAHNHFTTNKQLLR